MSREELLKELEKQLDVLFQNKFMDLRDYREKIKWGQLVPKPLLADDEKFEEKYPHHPLAACNRFPRLEAATEIRNICKEIFGPIPHHLLSKLHMALFDASAGVRLMIAESLFYVGDKTSIYHLGKIIEEDNESHLVRRTARIAHEKCRFHDGTFLRDDIEQNIVMLITDDIELAGEILDLVKKRAP